MCRDSGGGLEVTAMKLLNFGVSSAHLAHSDLLNEEDAFILEERGDILPEVVVGNEIKATSFKLYKLDHHTNNNVDKEENAHNEDDDPTRVHTTTTTATTNAGKRGRVEDLIIAVSAVVGTINSAFLGILVTGHLNCSGSVHTQLSTKVAITVADGNTRGEIAGVRGGVSVRPRSGEDLGTKSISTVVVSTGGLTGRSGSKFVASSSFAVSCGNLLAEVDVIGLARLVVPAVTSWGGLRGIISQ